MHSTDGNGDNEGESLTLDELSARRTACDRCRSHKLRCDRDASAEFQVACRRCLRAGTSCVTSAGAKIGRPAGPFRRQFEQQHQKRQCTSAIPGRRSDRQLGQSQMLTPSSSVMGDVPDTGLGVCDGEGQYQVVNPDPVDANHFAIVNLEDVDSTFNMVRRLTSVQQSTGVQQIPSHGYADSFGEHESVLRRLGDLHTDLTMDLEIARGAQRADECAWVCHVPEFADSCSFSIGRMLQASSRFLDIVRYFAPDETTRNQEPAPDCNIPTLLSILTCYIHLVRIYRITFVCIAESVPTILSSTIKLPTLLPGLHLAGYSLESHPSLQIRVLVQVAEDLLGRVDKAMGWSSQRCERISGGLLANVRASADLLQSIFRSELNEQHSSGILVGHTETLQEVFASLKKL